MKKLLIIFFCTLPVMVFSQSDYDTYEISSGEHREEFKIKISENKGAVDEVYIFSRSADNIYSNSVLIIKSKDLATFVDYLKFVNSKFREWTITAEDNDVKDLTKKIEADLRDYYMVAFGNNDWHFDRRVKIKSAFSITDREPLLYIYSGKVYSSNNSYIDSDGIFIPFSNPEDLDALIQKLDLSKMMESLNNKSDKESLFN